MIAPALEALKSHRQFIVYRLEPSALRPGKLDKLPCDASGRVVSAHDAAHWMSAAGATSRAQQFGTGWGIGFVLTPEAKRFCLDIDGCLQPDGQWSPLALQLCGLFPGAAVEVSASGTGLHVWGSYSGDMPAHACKNTALGIELYTDKRFVALGLPVGTVGDVATDCTLPLHAAIALYFPPDTVGDAAEWTTEPVPEWRGPVDDSELIRRASAAQSTASAFGGKASFADLWTGNLEALGRSYPAEGRPYDASSADAALAQRLAYWTGANCERIERLMRQSALARDKWDAHATYLPRTILGAVGRQEEVLIDEATRRREQIEEAMAIGEGSDSEPNADAITLDNALERFVLLNDGNIVFDKERPRCPVQLDSFHKRYASSKWTPPEESTDDKLMRMLDRRAKPKPIPVTKLWDGHGQRKTVHSVTFKAGGKFIVLNTDGQDCVNTWVPHDRTAPPGDPSVFLEHVAYLFGEDAPRFLDWVAHIEQKPGELPHQCWLHISKEEGTGRNWLSALMARLWPGNVAISFDLAGMFKDGFNGSLSRKIVAVVDEIRDGGGSEKWKNADVLKAAITAPVRKINPKFGRQSIEYNACRWLIFSNHIEAIAVNEADRRFNVVHTDHKPRDAAYYKRLYAGLSDPSVIAGVAHFLRTRDLSLFDPFAGPPMSESRARVIAASRSEADEILADVVQHWPVDIIHSSTLGELITGQLGGKITPSHRHALERQSIKAYAGKIRIGNMTARVSILRNHEQWKDADPHLFRDELARGPQQVAFGPGGARAFLDNLTAV